MGGGRWKVGGGRLVLIVGGRWEVSPNSWWEVGG